MLVNVETDKSRPLSDFLCVNHKNEIEALVMARFVLALVYWSLVMVSVCLCVCVRVRACVRACECVAMGC